MTVKKKKPTTVAIKAKHAVTITQRIDDNPDEALAKVLTRPEVTAARTIQTWQPLHDVDALAKILTQQVEEVTNGNMARPEAMLLSQAHTLDELFNNLAIRAHGQTHMPHYESFLRLALKAQSQCRTTLETLAAIKNPPVVFAKQANISNGHQQINNGVPTTHAEEIKSQPNELLEQTHGERLDTRTKTTASGIDTELAALE